MFQNESYADFSQPGNRSAMRDALAAVRAEFGREYELLIAGARLKTAEKLRSLNPSRPGEVVGIHQKATAIEAGQAVEAASAFFPEWSRTPAERRAELLSNAARMLHRRKLEFDAWLVFEAGKTWPEAEAETCEAIDFCDYYARQMLRFASPPELVQLPGERDRMVYLPLGAVVVIAPWNFPLAILAGMTTAALVAGNTVLIKPSSDAPTVAAKFVEVLLEAGFPERSFALLTGSGGAVGDALVDYLLTRLVAFTGSRAIG
ncbi:MAG: aldehyde dehydrogenase family protein, partial [Acidobacteriota bacterium]